MGYPDERNEAQVSDHPEPGVSEEGRDAPVEDFAAAGPAVTEPTDETWDAVTEEAEEEERHSQPGIL